MSDFSFSPKSLDRLSTCHVDLQVIFNIALKRSEIDFGINEGHRTLERQGELYAQGRDGNPGKIVTHIDGKTKKGKHNLKPSEAADIIAYVNGKYTYAEKYYYYIAGVVDAVVNELLENQLITHEITWGGTWKNFKDIPHFQLKKI